MKTNQGPLQIKKENCGSGNPTAPPPKKIAKEFGRFCFLFSDNRRTHPDKKKNATIS